MKKIVLFLASAIVGIAFCDIETDVVSVKGKGVGVDETAALKDAYRDAVETAVGLYVDVEQMEKNEELIKDQILTQSNAYIEGYRLTEKNEKDGLVNVKIMARVKKQALTRKISSTMPSTTVQIGNQLQQIHAQSTTKKIRGEEGAALLANALTGIDMVRQLFDVKLVSPVGVPANNDSQDGTVVQMDYLFSLKVNNGRYMAEFLPNMDRILSQISITAPEEVKLNVRLKSAFEQRRSKDLEDYDNPKKHVECSRSQILWGKEMDSFQIQIPRLGEIRGHTCLSINQKFESLPVVLVTKANDSLMVVRGKKFTIDEASASVYMNWHERRDVNGNESGRRRETQSEWNPTYAVSFLDESGEPLVEQNIQFDLKADTATNEGLYSAANCNALWLISPWQDCSMKEYHKWFRFKLPKDDLLKIKSIKVELAN